MRPVTTGRISVSIGHPEPVTLLPSPPCVPELQDSRRTGWLRWLNISTARRATQWPGALFYPRPSRDEHAPTTAGTPSTAWWFWCSSCSTAGRRRRN